MNTSTTTSTYAPVALFVYNRLKNTQEVVQALQANDLATETDLFIYADAAKGPRQEKGVEAVHEYLKTITGFNSVTIIKREENFYIERNIIEGISETITRFGRVIVLEDDGVTSPYFLTFMNQALSFYQDAKKVMHIGTFTFIDMPKDYNKTFFWRYTENTGGGWATWADRWEKFQHFTSEEKALASLSEPQKKYLQLDGDFRCLNALKGNPIPWDICWYMTLVRNDGLAVQSPHALTVNNGLFNGTHFSPLNRILGTNPFATVLSKDTNITLCADIVESDVAVKKLKEFYRTLGRRKRDRALHYFVRTLVFFKITKLLKYLLK